MTRNAFRLLAVAALALAVLLGGAGAASAHAQLVASTPANGAVLGAAPETITLEFNESVEARGKDTRIFTGDGTEIPAPVKSADRTVTVIPGSDLPEGTIVLSWAAVSADGHTINGSITFAVGAPTPGGSSSEVFTEPSTAGIGPLSVALAVATGLAVVGLVLFALLGRLRALEWCFRTGLALLVLAVLFASLHRNGVGWRGMRDWIEWVDGWLSWRGLVLGIGVLAAAYAVTAVRSSRRLPALVAVGILVLVAPAVFAVAGPAPVPVAGQPGGDPIAEVEAGSHTIRVEFDSVSVGTTRVTLSVLDDGSAVAPYASPRLGLHTDGLDLGDVTLTEESLGVYTGQVTVPQAGEWTAEVSIRLDEFSNPVLELPFRFGTRMAAPSGGH